MLPKIIERKTLIEKEPFPLNYPERLRIPSLALDAPVQHVGITYRGDMAAPENYRDVGWYKYGAVPGEPGNSAISGHVETGLATGVFSNLESIAAGEKVYIDTIGGETVEFEVVEKKIYNFNTKAEGVFGESEIPLIKLITCAGSWQPDYDTHAERLVVTARRVG